MEDLKVRRKKWRQFRSHIVTMTNETFNDILNRKGSSGELNFSHNDGTLDLSVQKDSEQESTQTDDVKALSGGERSFTTLALLLALGERLETPFRVMDEFDVFLDPVARKIALGYSCRNGQAHESSSVYLYYTAGSFGTENGSSSQDSSYEASSSRRSRWWTVATYA